MARRRRKQKLPPFVPIFRDMLKSPAWEALGNAARVAYVHIKAKCVSPNPGNLSLSYNEMERIMERRTFSGALKELEEFGFIEKTQTGGLYRRRNFFRLIEEWRKKNVTEILSAKEKLTRAKTALRNRNNSSGKNDTVKSGKDDTVGQESSN